MYGKYFASTFTGSMLGSGADIFAVWGYVIANTVEGAVELNPALLSALLGMPQESVERAIKTLASPDSRSRSRLEHGRRLIPDGGFQYRVVNHAHYRAIRNEEDRRAYNREAKRRERARRSAAAPETAVKAAVIPTVNDSQRMLSVSAHTEAEAETDTEEERSKPSRASRSAVDELPPTFLKFWRNYPKKKAKGSALKAWSKLSPPIDRVLAALEWQRNQPDWTRDHGQYIPHPATWLNSRSWEDEPFHPPANVNSNEPILSDKNRQTLTAVQRVIARRRAAQEAQ